MRAFAHDRFTYPLPPDHRFPLGRYRMLREAIEAEGIAEVNRAVGQMDDMTQQNAALVEEAAAAAESLHEQTVNLARAVSIFKVEGIPPLDETVNEAAEEPGGFHDPLDRRSPDSPMRGRAQRLRNPALPDASRPPRRERGARVSGTDG